MISQDGWVDWAIRRPGPKPKVYAGVNTVEALVLHSMEGWIDGSLHELDNPERQASWHWSNCIDGRFMQHYPIFSCCWASGNYHANTRFVAVESEGVAGTPLNELQLNNMVRLIEDLQTFGLTIMRGITLFEHNEVATLWAPNAGPTSCPSHRYDPLYTMIAEDVDAMTPQEREEHRALVALMGGRDNLLKITSPDQGMDLWAGFAQLQTDFNNHKHKTNQQTIVTGEVIV